MPEILVTPHAVRQYRRRIFSRLSDEEATTEIRAAFEHPLFSLPDASGYGTLYGLRNRMGHGFSAWCDPAPPSPEFLIVRTVGPWWFWHEAKALWKNHPKR